MVYFNAATKNTVIILTIKAIESDKIKDKPYKLPDFESLYLHITMSSTKSWRYDYPFYSKRKTYTIGKYPYISLSNARNEKELARQLLAHGKDTSFERKKSALLALMLKVTILLNQLQANGIHLNN